MGACAVCARPSFAQTAGPLRIGCGSREADAEVYFADANGFFKRAGLAVDIQQYAAGNLMAAAIVSGNLEIADSNVMTIAGARVRGLPFVYIAPGNLATPESNTAHIVAAPSTSYRTGKDLNGKVVSGISIGSVDEVEMLGWIDKNGGDFSSVKYVEVAPAELPAALAQGRIDAAVLNEPEFSAALAAKTVRVLGSAMDGIAREYVGNGWFASSDWIAKNVDAVRRFQAAMVETADWANANPERAAAILGKVTRIVEPRLHAKFARRLDPAAMQPMLDAAFRYKVLPRTLAAAEICYPGR